MTTDDLRTRAEMVAKRVWPDRWDAARITYPHAALQHYRRGAFVQGALWHATQQPSREELARVMREAGLYRRQADAIHALFENGGD